MEPVKKTLHKMRRVWMLEHCARGGLLVLGLALDGCLLCLLLNRVVGLPPASTLAVALLAVAAVAVLVIQARAAAPRAIHLAQLLDKRAGSRDLFASALEFARTPDRFGWMGALTCDLARSRAAAIALQPRWSLGSPRKWVAIGTAAIVLLVGYVGAAIVGSFGNNSAPKQTAVVVPPKKIDAPVRPPVEEPKAVEQTPLTTQEVAKEPEPEPTSEPAVQITNDMIDKYLAQMPTDQDIDLTGVTPIRWDADEASGKNNPQNQPTPEKIDPVKLDAALLKDLQDAKKKEDKSGGKEGGVDIAVMSDKGDTKVKGKEGGKESGESLANAVSKDPRGEPTRMAIKPARKGMQVRSFTRTASKLKGEEQPMSLLDFLAALEKIKTDVLGEKLDTAPLAANRSADRVVRQEGVPDDAAALTDAYFGQLRKADK
ncbi:MAG: hypothetical protein ACE15C_05905 [Phycisphaerae bacterium]